MIRRMNEDCRTSCVKELAVTSDLSQARLQRGNLLLKQGKLDEALSDFKRVVSDSLIALSPS